MDVNEHERLSNLTLSIYKLKKKNITFIVVLGFTSTVGSSQMSITRIQNKYKAVNIILWLVWIRLVNGV